ncbi:MAG: shikimate dehydrogenase [Bauldia litoralis]
MTAFTPATAPTIYFIGVTTGQSSILKVFPKWAKALGLADARIVGVDLPLHAPPEDYRQVVSFIKDDPQSLGALVTTHKIDLFDACRDLFDEIDPLARLTDEMSCVSKRDGRLIAAAKDPITGGLALDAIVPAGHFARTGGEAFFMGAGGSTAAITWHLMQAKRGDDRPSRIAISDVSQPRLDAYEALRERFDTDIPVETVLASAAQDNDRVMGDLRPGSLVVNATCLGKDGPCSPISDAAVFPRDGYAWELNYRGDLVFLRQARAAASRQPMTVSDGWVYFLHGWTRVIAEVFAIDIPTSGPLFEQLSDIAAPPGR